ncbi:MAG: PLD nuclease N-terminal domain-containing protein [Gammaproteobacteria bacterium]|nr:PLD nuclease N-terminal domain-containing protein [Gammaproteobacteria bacterium]MBT8150754.1 PLD nuclease N-terminal domain-containing protein [Gammaproteobacteria bacterium]NND38157.1 PLDc_N domain-containing protein [Pseudomonadales bacterium]NNM11620.1 PLDc_N domain-containing protein [Pseudomonadales bacterium]RZV57577.1 MAG: PLDc_N domain-containing protein [Pseudomonadales bacterium]
MGVEVGGLFGLVILIADIWAILNIVQSNITTAKKLVWILVVLILPLIGFIIWWLAGPRETASG